MSVHHSAQTHQTLISRMPEVTGQAISEWLDCLDCGPSLMRFEERVIWLRDEHSIPHGYASAIVHEQDLRRGALRTLQPRVDLDAARAYIRDHHRAVLATMREDGSPQLTPITVGVDDAGLVVISSRETAYKVKHIRRTGRAYVCVVPDGFFGEWIYVEGSATIQSLPDAMDGLVAYYRSISGEHPDWDEYRAVMERDQRCLIRIDPTRAGPDKHG